MKREHLGRWREADLVTRGFDHVEHAAEALLKAKSFWRGFHGTVAAHQQTTPEIVLELAYLMADCRLGEMKFLRGTREIPEPGSRFECPQ
jgi:hypothetical protein